LPKPTHPLEALQEIVCAKKQRQSGKHAILRGETIVATIETVERLKKAKEEAKERRPKRQNLARTSTPGPQHIDPPTNIDCGDSNSGEDHLDGIIVAYP